MCLYACHLFEKHKKNSRKRKKEFQKKKNVKEFVPTDW